MRPSTLHLEAWLYQGPTLLPVKYPCPVSYPRCPLTNFHPLDSCWPSMLQTGEALTPTSALSHFGDLVPPPFPPPTQILVKLLPPLLLSATLVISFSPTPAQILVGLNCPGTQSMHNLTKLVYTWHGTSCPPVLYKNISDKHSLGGRGDGSAGKGAVAKPDY